jgi:hypothetical protein
MTMWRLSIVLIIGVLLAGHVDGQEEEKKRPSEDKSEITRFEKLRVLPAEWLIGPYISSSGQNLRPLTNAQRRRIYVRQTFLNAGAYAARMFSSGVDQARGTPEQWGGGLAGYGRRFGSRYGQFVITSTFQASGNAVLGYEPRYDLCWCTGFWPRTRHAIVRNFITYNKTESERRPQVPLYVGALGAGMLSSIWLPGPRNAWKEGGRAVLWQMGIGAGVNWVSEFALDILHRIDGKRYPLPSRPDPNKQ